MARKLSIESTRKKHGIGRLKKAFLSAGGSVVAGAAAVASHGYGVDGLAVSAGILSAGFMVKASGDVAIANGHRLGRFDDAYSQGWAAEGQDTWRSKVSIGLGLTDLYTPYR